MGYLNNYKFMNWLNTPQDMEFTENGFPKLNPISIDNQYSIVGFNEKNSKKINPQELYLHFYLEDYMFETVWLQPKLHLNKLKEFKGVFSPDFSMYSDMPLPIQQWNHYRKQWLGAYWQSNGINVIPTVCWSDERSFNFCFEGIPRNSVVTVSAKGCYNDLETRKLFIKGYEKMLEILEPKLILSVGGERIPNLKGNIKFFKKKNERPFCFSLDNKEKKHAQEN